MTQADRKIYEAYKRSEAYTLDQVYGRCSTAKRNAYRYCIDLAQKYHGFAFRIISYNTFMFTVGFKFKSSDDNFYLCYITPSRERFIKLYEEV